MTLPAGMREGQALPEPIFTPSTKAAPGEHGTCCCHGVPHHDLKPHGCMCIVDVDENISFEQAKVLLGAEVAERIRDIALRIYKKV